MINSFICFDFGDDSISNWSEEDLDADFENVITDDDSDDGTCVKYSPKCDQHKDNGVKSLSYDRRSDRA